MQHKLYLIVLNHSHSFHAPTHAPIHPNDYNLTFSKPRPESLLAVSSRLYPLCSVLSPVQFLLHLSHLSLCSLLLLKVSLFLYSPFSVPRRSPPSLVTSQLSLSPPPRCLRLSLSLASTVPLSLAPYLTSGSDTRVLFDLLWLSPLLFSSFGSLYLDVFLSLSQQQVFLLTSNQYLANPVLLTSPLDFTQHSTPAAVHLFSPFRLTCPPHTQSQHTPPPHLDCKFVTGCIATFSKIWCKYSMFIQRFT
jgi:hypothetical protein